QGLPGVKIKLPHISGSEGAGEIARIGAEVNGWREGDRVVVTPPSSCGHCEFCRKNQDSMCLSYQMLGVHRDGCFAEYVAAPVQSIYPLPAHLTFEQAASIPLVFQTAWHMLVDRAKLQAG